LKGANYKGYMEDVRSPSDWQDSELNWELVLVIYMSVTSTQWRGDDGYDSLFSKKRKKAGYDT
jgi:hypothetical protein